MTSGGTVIGVTGALFDLDLPLELGVLPASDKVGKAPRSNKSNPGPAAAMLEATFNVVKVAGF